MPGTNQREASLGVVVASCDKYADTWKPLFDHLFKHWPNCPYPVYLVANHKTYEDPRVTTLLAGEDRDWSSTIAGAMAKFPHTHVLFLVDDAFLVAPVDGSYVDAMFKRVVREGFSFLRLRPNPRPAAWLDDAIGELGRNAAYRVSLFVTIWPLTALREILRCGESAWQFELDGTERSRAVGGFYCTRREVFRCVHGIEKGIWIRPTAHMLERMGYQIDRTHRPVMSVSQDLMRRYRAMKGFIFHSIPEQHRAATLKSVQRVYRLLNLR